MVTSIIQKSELEGAQRLDAEYYQPHYLEIKNKLRKLTTESLSQLAFSVKKGIFDLGPENYQDNGVPFIRTFDINDSLTNLDSAVYLNIDTHKRHFATQLSSGDIVFTKIGANIGKVAILPKGFEYYNFSQNVAGVHIDKAKIKPGYLLAYLTSAYGLSQILRSQMVSGQSKLELEDLRNLQIVILSTRLQDRIHKLIEGAQNEKEKSSSLYLEAEGLILRELRIKRADFEDELSYVVELPEAAERTDAEYFQPKYKKLIEKIKAKDPKKLGELSPRKTEQNTSAADKTYNYIEISDINAGTGETSYHEVDSSELPTNAKMKITGGELIISKVRPTRGAISIIPDDWRNDFVASGAFSIFKLPSPLREYVQVVLRSFVGKIQLERPTTGTSYPTITDKDIENVLVPILPKAVQHKIGDLVSKSHAARKKSKELLEEAKHQVEKLIEEG